MIERFGHHFVMRRTTAPWQNGRNGQGKMSSTHLVAATERQDRAKRRQIMEGARVVFLAQGFDGASMGEIARQGGVSKGTLYVYFDSKEALFEAIAEEECRAQAEQVFALDSNDHDVEAVLTRLGCAFVRFLCRPEAQSPLRTVIGIAERMPAIGKQFYETGPATGIARLSRYLEDQVAAGFLVVPDIEVAAAQFLDSCQSTMFKPLIFNFGGPPTEERISHVVGIAVRTFLASYAPH
jgi:AcrR family transcriptional regulator